MDPGVEAAHGTPGWAAERYVEELSALVGAGDELGLHPHSWRWDGTSWTSDQSPGWVAHCADMSFDAYEKAFDKPCRSYRHGDRFTSTALQAQLQRRGVRCDLTLEPGRPEVPGLVSAEASVGTLPRVPDDLVRPFLLEPDEPSDDPLMVMPLTSSFDVGHEAVPALFGTLLLWSPPRTFASLLGARFGGDDEVSHLAFAVRSDFALFTTERAWVEQNLRHIGSVLGDDVQWVTPSEARRRLLPAVVEPRPRAAWPASMTPDRLWKVTGETHHSLLDAELACYAEEQRALAHERQASVTVEQLEVALAATAEQERAATSLRSELEVMRATLTWRAHQRLLPLLSVLRRAFRPRGG